MKKIIFCFAVFVMTACGQGNYSYNIKDSNEEILAQVLKHTPLGTSWADVIKHCESLKLRCDSNESKGYRYQPSDYTKDKPRNVGAAHIKYYIGSYENTPYTSLDKTIYWGFDENKILIDIWVRQTIDAP
ncbi:hypothetical protein M6G53_12895 [Serratia nevei]|uniref:hypothetical protein n=1 Tax=Serratia nevei TaxID=2703794 RepID=UPI0020A01EEC|nr:hypothetical protein [Serratia nevei]MCP1106284.1 hypothetical protein [Serratia nevei]